MFDSSVAQPAYIAKDGDTLYQVSVDHRHDQQRLVVRQSRNDGQSFYVTAIIPLANAIEFAKSLVRSAEIAQMHADLDAILARDAGRETDTEMEGDIADDYEWIRQGC